MERHPNRGPAPDKSALYCYNRGSREQGHTIYRGNRTLYVDQAGIDIALARVRESPMSTADIYSSEAMLHPMHIDQGRHLAGECGTWDE